MKTSTQGCKTYGTHLFGYVVDFSSVTYAKSTRLPQINPVAENLRTVRLALAYQICVIGKTILRGVSVVGFIREVRTCGLTTYRHKAQDGIRYIVSEQFVLSINYKR